MMISILGLSRTLIARRSETFSKKFKYRTRARLNLSQVLDSLKYKPRSIKEMPPNFKEKHWRKLMKNKYKHSLILRGYGI